MAAYRDFSIPMIRPSTGTTMTVVVVAENLSNAQHRAEQENPGFKSKGKQRGNGEGGVFK